MLKAFKWVMSADYVCNIIACSLFLGLILLVIISWWIGRKIIQVSYDVCSINCLVGSFLCYWCLTYSLYHCIMFLFVLLYMFYTFLIKYRWKQLGNSKFLFPGLYLPLVDKVNPSSLSTIAHDLSISPFSILF